MHANRTDARAMCPLRPTAGARRIHRPHTTHAAPNRRKALMPTPALELALNLAAIGRHVFPLAGANKRPLPNCPACRAPDGRARHPIEQCPCLPAGGWCHGVRAATTNPHTIIAWWTTQPGALVGIATGPSGLVLIDIDAHHTDPPTDPARQLLPGIDLTAEPGVPDGWQDTTRYRDGRDSLRLLAQLRGGPAPWPTTRTDPARTIRPRRRRPHRELPARRHHQRRQQTRRQNRRTQNRPRRTRLQNRRIPPLVRPPRNRSPPPTHHRRNPKRPELPHRRNHRPPIPQQRQTTTHHTNRRLPLTQLQLGSKPAYSPLVLWLRRADCFPALMKGVRP